MSSAIIKDLPSINSSASLEDVISNYNDLVTHLNFFNKSVSLEQNFDCQIVQLSFNSGEEKVIPHSLGKTPRYRIILRQEGNGVISDIPSAWNQYSIKLKNNGTNSVTATVMIVRE